MFNKLFLKSFFIQTLVFAFIVIIMTLKDAEFFTVEEFNFYGIAWIISVIFICFFQALSLMWAFKVSTKIKAFFLLILYSIISQIVVAGGVYLLGPIFDSNFHDGLNIPGALLIFQILISIILPLDINLILFFKYKKKFNSLISSEKI